MEGHLEGRLITHTPLLLLVIIVSVYDFILMRLHMTGRREGRITIIITVIIMTGRKKGRKEGWVIMIIIILDIEVILGIIIVVTGEKKGRR